MFWALDDRIPKQAHRRHVPQKTSACCYTFRSTFHCIVESSHEFKAFLYYVNPIAFQLYPIMPRYGANSIQA